MNELGVTGRVLAGDITPASAAFQLADEGVILPRTDDEAYGPAIDELVARRDVGLIVPTTDRDLPLLSRRRDRLAKAGCTVMVGSEPIIAACRDKGRLAGVLQKAGIPAVRTWPLAEGPAACGFPCFVKPTSGSSGIGAARIDSAEELARHVERFGEDLIVQEYVPGREVTVDVYRSRDGAVRCVVPRQRLTVRAGEVQKGITWNHPEIISAATRLAEALDGLWGAFCCQCRLPEAEGDPPRFFEVNPRFGGGVPLAVAAGANLPRYLLEEVLGLPISAECGRFTDRLLMIRYDQSVFVQVDDPSSLPGYDTPQFR
jgi:carbamoyl-phosphate synthase large subunit